MDSSLSSPSSSASCASAAPSIPACFTLSALPAAILQHVCSFLSPRQLLVTLARTATSTRDLLTAGCFSRHSLELGPRPLSLLSAFHPSSSLTLWPLHGRVLTECKLSMGVNSECGSMQAALDSLDHFPACRTLSIRGSYPPTELSDPQLYALLHHPATLSCDELHLRNLERPRAEQVVVYERQMRADVRFVRSKRTRDDEPVFSLFSQKRDFDWGNVRLPSVTRLSLDLCGKPLYTGGAAFLTAHTALSELEISMSLVPVGDLTAVFLDAGALPHLARFTLHDNDRPITWMASVCNVDPLLTALATTVVGASGKPRAMERLSLQLCASTDVIAATARMPHLTSLNVMVKQTSPGWLEHWTATEEMCSAFPLLQECVVHSFGQPLNGAARDMLPFFQAMACRPLQLLDIRTAEPIVFDAAAMVQLARCHRLRELSIASVFDDALYMDWTDPALFTGFSSGCFSHLRTLKLEGLKLSAEVAIATASAARQLRTFSVSSVVPSCHPAVICVIVGAYCEEVEEVSIGDKEHHTDAWRDAQAADIVAAYQTAVAAAGRGDQYRSL